MAMEAPLPTAYSPEYSYEYHAYDECEIECEYDDTVVRERVPSCPSEVSDPDYDSMQRNENKRVKRRFLRLRSLFHDLNCTRSSACLSSAFVPRLGQKSKKSTTQPPPPPSSNHNLNSGIHSTNTTSHSHSASIGYRGAHSWAMACGLQEECSGSGSGSGATGTTIATTDTARTRTRTPRNIYKKLKNSKNQNLKEKQKALALGGFNYNHDNHELLRAYEDEIEFDYDFWEEGERDIYFHADFTAITSTDDDDNHVFQNGDGDNSFFTDAGKEMGFEVTIKSNDDGENEAETWMQFNSPSMSFAPSPTKDVNVRSKNNLSPKTPLASTQNNKTASFPTSPGHGHDHGTPATVTDTSSTWDDSEGDDDDDVNIKSNSEASTPRRKIGNLVMPSFEEEDDSDDDSDGDEDGVGENINNSDSDNDSACISFDDKGSKSSSDMEGFSYSATSLGASTFQRGKKAQAQAALSPPWSPNLDLILNQDLEGNSERIHAYGQVVMIQDPPKTIRADVNDLFQTSTSTGQVAGHGHVNPKINNTETETDDQGTHDTATDTQQTATTGTGLSNYMSIFYPEEIDGDAIDTNLLNDSISTIGEEGADENDNGNENGNDNASGISASPSDADLQDGAVPKDDFSYLFNASMSSI